MFPENGSNIWAFNTTAMSSRDVAHSNIWADLSAQIFEHFPVVYATDLLTEFEINVSAAVDNKMFLGVSWTFLNHWTRLAHCRFLLDMTSRVSIYRMCCKCYKLSALTVVDGNSTFLNFTLKVARRNGVNCNKQFSMVIIMLFFLSQARSVVCLEYAAT